MKQFSFIYQPIQAYSDYLVRAGLIRPFLGAVVGLASGLLGNSARKDEAKKNREFQQYNSDTSYQRQMEDMKKAGLNPMLAKNMGGASTPSGSQANIENLDPLGAMNQLATAKQQASNAKVTQKVNKAILKSPTLVNTAAATKVMGSGGVALQSAKVLASAAASESSKAKAKKIAKSPRKKGQWGGITNAFSNNSAKTYNVPDADGIINLSPAINKERRRAFADRKNKYIFRNKTK